MSDCLFTSFLFPLCFRFIFQSDVLRVPHRYFQKPSPRRLHFRPCGILSGILVGCGTLSINSRREGAFVGGGTICAIHMQISKIPIGQSSVTFGHFLWDFPFISFKILWEKEQERESSKIDVPAIPWDSFEVFPSIFGHLFIYTTIYLVFKVFDFLGIFSDCPAHAWNSWCLIQQCLKDSALSWGGGMLCKFLKDLRRTKSITGPHKNIKQIKTKQNKKERRKERKERRKKKNFEKASQRIPSQMAMTEVGPMIW